MVLSNAERQARFRQRKIEEARTRIDRYRADRDAALEVIRKIDNGWSFSCAQGNEPMRDYTQEYRAEKEREAKMYEEFAAMWQKDIDADTKSR